MRKIQIVEVALDEASRVHVKPQIGRDESYKQIYRTAMSVRWDRTRRTLYAIAPDFDQLASYKHILKVLKDECDHELALSDNTEWNGIPEALKSAIQRESD